MSDKEKSTKSSEGTKSTPSAEVKIIPPQSVTVQNSMHDKLPPQIKDK